MQKEQQRQTASMQQPMQEAAIRPLKLQETTRENDLLQHVTANREDQLARQRRHTEQLGRTTAILQQRMQIPKGQLQQQQAAAPLQQLQQ